MTYTTRQYSAPPPRLALRLQAGGLCLLSLHKCGCHLSGSALTSSPSIASGPQIASLALSATPPHLLLLLRRGLFSGCVILWPLYLPWRYYQAVPSEGAKLRCDWVHTLVCPLSPAGSRIVTALGCDTFCPFRSDFSVLSGRKDAIHRYYHVFYTLVVVAPSLVGL